MNAMLPCAALNDLKTDLLKISKSTADFEKSYEFAPNAVLTIFLERRPSGTFHLQVKSPHGEESAVNTNYKNIAAMALGFAWQAVCSIIAQFRLEPCEEVTHGGSDEILSLYKSLSTFNQKQTLPFSSSAVCPCNGYELLTITDENNRCFLTLETKAIYGNLVKSVVDVQYREQVASRGQSMLDDILGSWLKPQSIRSYKVPLEGIARTSNQKNDRRANKTTL